MEHENSARSFKSVILLACYVFVILSLKYLFTAHNFVINFLVLIVLSLAVDIVRNKNLASKLQIKKSLGSQERLQVKNIYKIFSMLNSKKMDLFQKFRLVDRNNNNFCQ